MRRYHYFSLSVLVFACAANNAWAQLNYAVSLNAPADFTALLSTNLDIFTEQASQDMDQQRLDALVRETPALAAKLLQTVGYFDAQVSVDHPGAQQYVVKVLPGEPVIIDDVVISLDGDVRKEQDFQQRYAALLEAWSLPIGAPYNQSDWDNSKRAVLKLTSMDRFPLAKLTYSQADIDPVTHHAQLTVRIDSGPRIRFGDIEIKGLQRYPENVVRGMADFKKGEGYDTASLIDYQTALGQSSYFSSATVNADIERINDGYIPVDVSVVEVPKQKVELGLTYDSVSGAGVRVGYDYYNLFNRGYTGSVLADLSEAERNLTLGLSFPRQSDGYAHSVTVSYKETDIQGVRTRVLDTGTWRIRTRDNIDSRFGLEYLQESEEAGGVYTNRTYAVIGVFGWTKHAVDDLMRPRSGYLFDINLSSTFGGILASTPFVRGYSRMVGYWSPFPKWGTFVGRLEAGQVWSKDSNNVPESRLFRAGGVNSVRGYEYQSLGLPGPNGSVLGGSVVATGSVEYQIPVAKDWYIALFHDEGDAATNWQSFKLYRSNGVGLRWLSPVAPLSLDIAKGENGGKIRWDMSLGLAF